MAKNAGAMKEYMFRISEILGFDDMFNPEFTAFLEWLQEQPGYSVGKTKRPIWLKQQYGYWQAKRKVRLAAARVAARWLNR